MDYMKTQPRSLNIGSIHNFLQGYNLKLRIVGFYGDPKKVRETLKELVDRHPTHYISQKQLKDREVDRCHRNIGILIWSPQAKDIGEGVIDLYGRRKLFAFENSGCISNPRIQIRFLQTVEKLTSMGCRIVVDALRFPSPADGLSLLSCFCRYCISKIPKLDIVRKRLRDSIDKRDSRSFAEILIELGEYRSVIATELAEKAKEISRKYGAVVESAVFPPSISKIVGQNLHKLCRIYDRTQIMLYHKCRGPACYSHEIYSLYKTLTNLKLNPNKVFEELDIAYLQDFETLNSRGVEPEEIARELEKSKEICGDKAIPILWVDKDIDKIIDTAGEIVGEAIVFSP